MRAGAARKLDPPAPDPEERTPESFLEDIRAALNAGTQRGAREIAARGLVLFPDHPELQRLYHALKPGEARSVSGPRQPDRRETFNWIRENAWKYRGQWIAVLDSRLIAASPDFNEVYQAALASNSPVPPVIHLVD
ncbi:MAG TPA: DUF5678 domain-containing protein [Thermoanaerobaculia bacterium]|nr:DUF5678 domain-containing protein [Thermoanaerobaculia bacterium]